MELLKVDTLEEALEKLYNRFKGQLKKEFITLDNSFGRILAEDIICDENIPAFNRSTVDGYAVQAKDTMGAGESMPTFLEVVGEVEMGKASDFTIEAGKCAYVPTGGMVPEGADAVIMVEHCQPFGTNQIAVYDALSYGKNMVFAGDDVAKGQLALKKGRKIKPADMGLLASMGKVYLEVYRPWRVYIISTGDEIVEAYTEPKCGQMRDVNTYGLMGEIENFGFELAGWELVSDDYDLLLGAVNKAAEISDIVLISGGSSKGKKDVTAKVIDEVTGGGVFVHGLAVKPGKPTILGMSNDKNDQLVIDDSKALTAESLETPQLFVGLPGHPVAALLLFRLIVGGLWERLTAEEGLRKHLPIKGRMSVNLAASPGRKTFQLVKIDNDNAKEKDCNENVCDGNAGAQLTVTPILGKSGLIRIMSEADGYIVLDVNDEGINKGEEVEVFLL